MKRIVYVGREHQVRVSAQGAKVVVEIEPRGPIAYAGIGPFYRWCSPHPPVWWQPWTWLRRDPQRAIRDAIAKIHRIEAAGGREAARAYVSRLPEDPDAGVRYEPWLTAPEDQECST